MALYDEGLVFQDQLLKINYNSLSDFAAFYNWPDTNFQKHPDFPKTLIVEELICEDRVGVATGYFTPFYYKGKLYAMDAKFRFCIWLQFNEEGKIIKQTDWIAYPKAFIP